MWDRARSPSARPWLRFWLVGLGFILSAPVRAQPPLSPPAEAVLPPALTAPLLPPDFGDAGGTGEEAPFFEPGAFLWPVNPPLGYTGPSGVRPTETQQSAHFVPVEDRWRQGFPEWDRYDRDHPLLDEYPYVEGRLVDPFHQNVLKGDYPILGQHNFLNVTLTENLLFEYRQVPTPTSPFEVNPHPEFFGNPNQFFMAQNLFLSLDWIHGDGAFKPADWRVKVTPVFNFNLLSVGELSVVNPDPLEGKARFRTDFALEEYFFETKLADLSPSYDFVSVRAGSQPFVSDFRGFVFADVNRMVRLFGSRNANRDQFNLAWVIQQEKETNSLLNTFEDRRQSTVILNYYRQDFLWPGYTAQVSYHYNRDLASVKFDKNDFLVRPDPAGVAAPHEVNAHYLGWSGDGHINRFNISHAFYWVLGNDELNPIAGAPQTINAQMAALELSYDRDWIRFRGSYFWASGDTNPLDGEAEGFDTIFDNPNFAGGQFSYWNRQNVRLFGVSLVNRLSLVPDLRSSKFQGQSNFVNPGLHLINLGADADLTPRFRVIGNCNFLWFDDTEVLEIFTFQPNISHYIGVDLSLGAEYRPLLSNNVILVGGVSCLVPGQGFEDLYTPLVGNVDTLYAGFVDAVFQY